MPASRTALSAPRQTKDPGPGCFHMHRDTSIEIKDHLCSAAQRTHLRLSLHRSADRPAST